MTFTDKDNNIYVVRTATLEDIIPDMANAVDMLTKVGDTLDDYTEYQNKMTIAATSGVALTVTKNGIRAGAVYIYHTEGVKAYGACLYSNSGICVLFALIHHIRSLELGLTKMCIVPHGNNLKYFISCAEATSIRAYHSKVSSYVIVNFAKLASKMQIAEAYYGFTSCHQ